MTTKYLGDGIWARRTNIDSADIMLPVEIQASHAETLITHNAVAVPKSSSSTSDWVDCDGFSTVGFGLVNNADTESSLIVQYSYDGVNLHAEEQLVRGTGRYKPAHTDITAPYIRVKITNDDTVASHTMSCYAYLRA